MVKKTRIMWNKPFKYEINETYNNPNEDKLKYDFDAKMYCYPLIILILKSLL